MLCYNSNDNINACENTLVNKLLSFRLDKEN